MPELSRFYGIVIRMYFEADAPHHRPHFHAQYQKQKAVFAIDSIEVIAGEIPKAEQRMVEAWAEIHQQELLEDWNRLQAGSSPNKIEPLR